VSFRQSALVPQKARTVLVTKIGDCKDVATLGISMLHEVGIKADYVLVQTHWWREKTSMSSLPLAFNHCIVRWRLNRESVLLILPRITIRQRAFRFRTGMRSVLLLIRIPSAPCHQQTDVLPDNIKREITATISDDNTLLVSDVSSRSGRSLASFRSWLRNKGQKDKEKKRSTYAGERFQTMKLNKFWYR